MIRPVAQFLVELAVDITLLGISKKKFLKITHPSHFLCLFEQVSLTNPALIPANFILTLKYLLRMICFFISEDERIRIRSELSNNFLQNSIRNLLACFVNKKPRVRISGRGNKFFRVQIIIQVLSLKLLVLETNTSGQIIPILQFSIKNLLLL